VVELADAQGLSDKLCLVAEHLNDEYAGLARSAIAALCRKRPSPLASGNLQTWGCAVLYALGQVNFLSDKSTTPYFYCVINAIWLQVVGASTDSMDIARGILRARR
jgi:hypothetical protein